VSIFCSYRQERSVPRGLSSSEEGILEVGGAGLTGQQFSFPVIVQLESHLVGFLLDTLDCFLYVLITISCRQCVDNV